MLRRWEGQIEGRPRGASLASRTPAARNRSGWPPAPSQLELVNVDCQVVPALASDPHETPKTHMRFPWSKKADPVPLSGPRFRKHARVFAHRTDSKVLVVTMNYVGGIGALQTEARDVFVLELGNDRSVVADAILKALDATCVLPEQNLRDKKRSDWPAYQASGCRSIRQFEADFVHVHVSGANEFNHFVWIEGWPEKGAALSVRCSASLDAPAIGVACARVIDACRTRQF